MNTFFVFCTSLIIFATVDSQVIRPPNKDRNFSIGSETDIFQKKNDEITVHYASRFTNVSIISETGVAYVIDLKIHRDRNEHKVVGLGNVTKDFRIKSIEVILHRCSSEKVDCEDFQRWKFTHILKSLVYMKNQIWTPIFDHITPKLDYLPIVKKNIYQTIGAGANFDAEAIMRMYPEALNYFWRGHVILRDPDDKKACTGYVEVAIFSYVERNRKRSRRRNRPNSGKK